MNEQLPKEERAVRKVSANEVWLVRIRDNATLTKVKVWNKYIKTVELKMVDGIGSSFYTWNDVEFVERLRVDAARSESVASGEQALACRDRATAAGAGCTRRQSR